MIKEIKEYALVNDVPIFEEETRDFIIDLIKNEEVSNILEIGSAIGYSAICMASVNNDIKITTIERDRERFDIACDNISNMDLDKQISIYCEDALEFDETQLKKEYDLIFIDAAKAQYQKFFEKYAPYLKKDGLVIIDNVDFHGFVNGDRITTNRNTRQLVGKIKRFLEYIENNNQYTNEYFKIGDGIIVCKRNDVNEK
ncbi:MAG: O-methyltransferase [Erysipelotrichales bacterium]